VASYNRPTFFNLGFKIYERLEILRNKHLDEQLFINLIRKVKDSLGAVNTAYQENDYNKKQFNFYIAYRLSHSFDKILFTIYRKKLISKNNFKTKQVYQ